MKDNNIISNEICFEMKIAIINRHIYDNIGGSEIQCDLIARKLTQLMHEVIYLVINGDENYLNTPYKTIPVCIKNTDDISNILDIEHPDIIYWRYNKNHFLKISKIIKKKRIPMVFGISSLNDTRKWITFYERKPNESILKYLYKNFMNIIVARVNHFGFKNADGATILNYEYINRIPVRSQIYLPNSMEIDFVPFNWRKKFVFWCANIKKAKRPEICIAVAKELQKHDIDVLMVGKIQDTNYDFFNNKLLLPNNLHYLGAKSPSQVNGIIKESILLFHTCKPEGFGNIFIQAWKIGVPTISYEFDPGSFITTKNIGIVANKNINKLISSILRLCKDEGLRTEMINNAKRFANMHFNPEINIKNLENYFLEIIKYNNEKTFFSDNHDVKIII